MRQIIEPQLHFFHQPQSDNEKARGAKEQLRIEGAKQIGRCSKIPPGFLERERERLNFKVKRH